MRLVPGRRLVHIFGPMWISPVSPSGMFVARGVRMSASIHRRRGPKHKFCKQEQAMGKGNNSQKDDKKSKKDKKDVKKPDAKAADKKR